VTPNTLSINVTFNGSQIDVTTDIESEDDRTTEDLQRIHDVLIAALRGVLGEPRIDGTQGE
jgi:hypothetical protein